MFRTCCVKLTPSPPQSATSTSFVDLFAALAQAQADPRPFSLPQHGFTLFLSLILSRTYSLVLDLIKAQEDLAIMKTQVSLAVLLRSSGRS